MYIKENYIHNGGQNCSIDYIKWYYNVEIIYINGGLNRSIAMQTTYKMVLYSILCIEEIIYMNGGQNCFPRYVDYTKWYYNEYKRIYMHNLE